MSQYRIWCKMSYELAPRTFAVGASVARSLALAAILLPVGVAFAAADEASLEDQVVQFCKSNLGEKVGNGQCAVLAFQALKTAGAKTKAGADSPNKGDYVWGKQIYLLEATANGPQAMGKLSDVRPGDIVQYRETKFATAHYEHHTSVVAHIDAKTLKVYQQNAGGKQFVTEGAIRVDKLSAGWIRIYRPVPAGK